MKKEKINQMIFVSLTIISIFLLVINFIPIFVVNEGITTRFSGNLWPNRAAFVNKSNPDFNYNFSVDWRLGIIDNSCETYINFNLDLLPEKAKELYFVIGSHDTSINYPPPSGNIEVNLILVDSNWNTSGITWNNKPERIEILDTVNLSDIEQGPIIVKYNFEKTSNITELIGNNDISLCINITENQIDLNDTIYLRNIQLIWRYMNLLISDTTIISSCIIFSILIGIVLYVRIKLSFCPNCKTIRKLNRKFCTSCKTNFGRNIIIQSGDYQLILVTLWIFALLEGSFLIWRLPDLPTFYKFIGSFLSIFLIINWVIICILQIIFKIKKYFNIRALLKKF